MFGKLLENVKKNNPLIHNITNYVTANDCANILIAVGASPIMASEKFEAKDISTMADGLNINMGTIDRDVLPSMIIAGKNSNSLGHPIVFDPVGLGASKYRLYAGKLLLKNVKFSVIKGNISEIKTLAFGKNLGRGVDAKTEDLVENNKFHREISFIKSLSKRLESIIVATGPIDIVTDGDKVFLIKNGHPMMAQITGSGCMASALISAFVSANKDKALEATAAALATIGLAGELAYGRMTEKDGNSSYRNFLIDEVYNLSPQLLDSRANFKIL